MNDFFSKKLNSFINNKPADYWDFSFRKKNLLEKVFKYPAKMVSDMQYELLEFFVNNTNVNSICDPFMGSGTIIDLAIKLNFPLIYGNDLNPYSYIINKYKFMYNNFDYKLLEKDVFIFKNNYKNLTFFDNYNFNKINKWYKKEIIIELSKIRKIIYSYNFNYKCLLEIALMNIAKDFSNDRKSTSKLHIKKDEDIKKINSDLIFDKFLDYVYKIFDAIKNNLSISNQTTVNLFNNDIKKLNTNIMSNSVDIIMTSPPYGDNKTTIAYGQFSILPLLWLDKFLGTEYENNFSKIDKDSLGGNLNEISKKLDFLLNISNSFRTLHLKFLGNSIFNKVISFIYDFYLSLKNMDYILKNKGYLVLTLGNRRVSNIEIPFDKITIEILNYLANYSTLSIFKRNIPIKTIPNITSNVKNKPVKSISKETVLILQKVKY